MQLTDPVSEAAMDLGDDSESSGSELDDDVLDRIQAAEQAVASDPGNYEGHVAVRPLSLPCRLHGAFLPVCAHCYESGFSISVAQPPNLAILAVRNGLPSIFATVYLHEQTAHLVHSSSDNTLLCRLQLVDLLSQHKVRERLRNAREAFAAQFPLTEQLWLAWIADTLDEVAQGTVTSEALLSLAEQSLQDYLSVNLWQQYLTYAAALPYRGPRISLQQQWHASLHAACSYTLAADRADQPHSCSSPSSAATLWPLFRSSRSYVLH